MESLEQIKTMSSREIAELTLKEHRNVLADCDKLNESYRKLGLAEISAGVYFHPQNKQEFREYLLTKMQTFDLMTGYDIELRIKVNRRWEELETRPQLDFSNPDTVLMLAQNWKEEQQKRLEAEKQIELQRPAVIFRESVTASDTVISVGDLAKLICQNGIETGEKRLYQWLVDNEYLICRKRWSKTKNRYDNDYMPYQRYIEMGVFFVTETVIQGNGEPFVKHTVKITGKGQVYFINKFLLEKAA